MRNLKQLTIKSTVFIGLFILFSTGCKEEFINLESNLSIDNALVGANEGEDLIFNLILDKELSEDLIMEGEFSTDGINRYANDEDYSKAFFYSSDNGITWQQEPNSKQIRFPQRNLQLKVKLATNNDNDVEIKEEEFKITFKKTNSNIKLANSELSIKSIIIDDDNVEPLAENLIEWDIKNNTIKAVNSVSSKFQKDVVDGKYKKLKELFETIVTDNIDVTFSKFIIFDNVQGAGGYTGNLSPNNEIDDFVMGININLGYHAFNPQSYRPEAIEFNSNGIIAYIIIHELAHVLGQNHKHGQAKERIFNPGECTGFYERRQATCFPQGSYVTDFHNRFYLTPQIIPPLFVTDYAGTQVVEDFAESWAYFVCQEFIPPLNDSTSSTALRKIHFFNDYPELVEIKKNIVSSGIKLAVSRMPVLKSAESDSESIYMDKSFMNKINGKFVPCQELPDVIEELRKKK